MTLSKTTIGIMTLGIMAFYMTTFSTMTFRIMIFSKMTFNIIAFILMTFNIRLKIFVLILAIWNIMFSVIMAGVIVTNVLAPFQDFLKLFCVFFPSGSNLTKYFGVIIATL